MFNSPTKISSIIKPLLYCAMNKLHQDGDWQTISDHFLSVEWFNNIGSHNVVPTHAKMGSRHLSYPVPAKYVIVLGFTW